MGFKYSKGRLTFKSKVKYFTPLKKPKDTKAIEQSKKVGRTMVKKVKEVTRR